MHVGLVLQSRSNLREDRLQVLQYLRISEPQHVQSQAFEIMLAGGIVVRLRMNHTVNLDDEPCRRTVKIHNEAVNGMLTPDRNPQLTAAHMLPQTIFGGRGCVTMFAS